jgi:hypothetical protein
MQQWLLWLKSRLREDPVLAEQNERLVRSEDLTEGYPSLRKVLHAIANHEDVPNVGVRRVEVNCQASGEASFNVWRVDVDEVEGGYFSKSDLS